MNKDDAFIIGVIMVVIGIVVFGISFAIHKLSEPTSDNAKNAKYAYLVGLGIAALPIVLALSTATVACMVICLQLVAQ
jgi:uncharacterized membrane protein